MQKKSLLRISSALLAAMLLTGCFAPVLSAHAAAPYESNYTEKSNWEELILPALQKATDTKGVYRQLKLSLQYHTLSEGNLYNLYERDDVSIPLEVFRMLYEDGLMSGYLYKTLTHQAYSAEDFAAVFDVDTYYTSNPDLASTVGADPAALFSHFLNNGMAEGRVGNKDFNLSLYKENYPDLVKVYGDDNPSYYIHYMLYGKAEGRIADKAK